MLISILETQSSFLAGGVVYVVGDVGKPGGFLIENNDRLTVLQAIALAQGTNRTASQNKARLIRKTQKGREEMPIPVEAHSEWQESLIRHWKTAIFFSFLLAKARILPIAALKLLSALRAAWSFTTRYSDMSVETTKSAAQTCIAGSVRRRLVRGFGASALGPIVTLIIQVLKVPIFLHMWGARLYGEWLILSAIPIYLALSDIGFGNVAASDMTMHVAGGRHEAALETFQSTWVLICSISLIMMGLVSVGAWFVPWGAWMKLSVISDHCAAQVMLVFSAYVLFSLQNGILDSAFRCDGNYALGATSISIVRLSEAVIAIIPLLCGRGPLLVASTYLAVRAVGCVLLTLLVRRKSPWLRYGTTHANLASIRRLLSPAFAFMAFPIGNALSLQGLTVVIAMVLGPVAVVAFSTMRTLSRVGFQILTRSPAQCGRSCRPHLAQAISALPAACIAAHARLHLPCRWPAAWAWALSAPLFMAAGPGTPFVLIRSRSIFCCS